MSFTNPALTIPRHPITGMEGMWVKMWDPPTASPSTPDKLNPTNPVPEVMAAAGYQKTPSKSHTVQRDLLHGASLSTWDSKPINFFLFRDGDNPATGAGNFPGATIRVPRGVWFHGEVLGHGPPPHTIHWHGIEPTPINDGVGHCSMEVGHYTYQWQPNFIGFYFNHCHRNTVQHFEFGLYNALLIDPPDAYFATQWNPYIPIGAGRDGKRRIAANLSNIRGPGGPLTPDPASGAGFEGAVIPNPFPGFIGGDIRDLDPQANNANLPAFLKFPVNPHAMTVPFDVEALWVVDDRDSVWSDLAPDARITYPKHGNIPGFDDNFHGNAGGGTDSSKFFAFNDFNPDYWYVTGVNFPGPKLGTGTIPAGIVVPPELMSGVSGVQVSINASVGQTILVRVLDAAYNNITVKFPVDVTIIAWDGRALGVAPFNAYNHAYLVPANTPIHSSVARRFDALIKVDAPFSGFATVEFTNTRSGTATGTERPLLFTGRIPINIVAAPTGAISGTVTNDGTPLMGVTIGLTGAATGTAVTDASGNYSFARLASGSYTLTPFLSGFGFSPASRNVTVNGAEVSGQNFARTTPGGTFTISGSVLDSKTGAPIAGVQMNLAGNVNTIAVSDLSGNYSFSGLPNGRYSVMASHASYRFSPRIKNVTISGANKLGHIFRGRKL